MTDQRFTARIRRGRNAIAAERERTAAERAAFRAFADRVRDLSVQRPTFDRSTDPAGFARSLAGGTTTSSPALDRVRAAYERTVLALPHYDEDYGEPAIENLAAEFGTELGATLSGRSVLTPELRAALYEASLEATSRRAAFLSVLDEEIGALEDAACELRRIESESTAIDRRPTGSFTTLRRAREDLRALGERCERLVADRQATLRKPRAGGQWRRQDDTLNQYLYEELEVTHPVLADASNAAATLRDERLRLERALSHTT